MSIQQCYYSTIKSIWKKFLCNKQTKEDITNLNIDIYKSWVRSRKNNIDPYKIKSETLSRDLIEKRVVDNYLLISIAHSYMSKLYSFVEGEHFTVVVSDSEGYVLDLVGGTSEVMHESKSYTHLKIGVNRSEAYAGTNGLGTCLFLDKPMQICGPEHYLEAHHDYTSSAAPIHDPEGTLIGCLNMVGPRDAHYKHTLGMVVAAVDGIEKEIKLRNAYDEIFFSNSQLKSTLQSISSGLILIDPQGMIVQYNNNAAKLLKQPPNALIEASLTEIMKLDPPALDLLTINENFYNREVSVSIGKNESIYLSLTASIMEGKDGNKAGTVLLFDSARHINKIVNQRSGFTARYTFDSIIGSSKQLSDVKNMGNIAAQGESNVLLLGESGTGKELVAQAIHNASRRASGPFIAINCGSLPKGLIESELFGYEGGAFTGASREGRPGKFELADQGTIFLDEIGDMPLDLQASLLRVLQLKEITRIGGKRTKPVNVRIIAATNRNLEESILDNSFRADLYYRLNVFPINVPALRERKSDLRELINYFIIECNAATGGNISSISEDAFRLLMEYDWPGNIRELQNTIERGANIARSGVITMSDLPNSLIWRSLSAAPGNKAPFAPTPAENSLSATSEKVASTAGIRETEKEMIIQAMNKAGGNVSRAAQILGIGRKSLYCKLNAHAIEISRFRAV